MDALNGTTVLKLAKNLSFSWYDYIFFSFMLVLSAAIGVYFGCFGSKQKTADEYLMGSKKMGVFPVAVSLVASHVSGITLLAVPADIYRFGATYWLCCPFSLLAMLMTIYIYLPVFENLKTSSIYEYLERRFDTRTRSLASFLFTLGLFLYLPIVIYIPALAFSASTGINVHLITPVVCGVCIFYTTLGGLKAVVWTDTLQFIVTIGALFTVCYVGVQKANGLSEVFRIASDGGRLNIFDFDPDPTKRDSFWIACFGMTFGMLANFGIHQSCVQKYLSVGSAKRAKVTIVLFTFGLFMVSSAAVLIGLIMYSYYEKCDPFTRKIIERNDQLLPYYIMDVASHIPGLSGLFIAGIFSAALSTLSACLNCLAGTIYEDFVRKWTTTKLSESHVNHILKTIVIIIGLICVALVYIIEQLGGLLPLAVSLGSVSLGPTLALFTLGVLFPKASSKGTFYGCITGLLFISWVVVMAQYYKMQGLLDYPSKPISVEDCPLNGTIPAAEIRNSKATPPFALFKLSFYYYVITGCVVTIVTALFYSFFLKNEDPPVERELLSPVIYFLLPEAKTTTVNDKVYLKLDQRTMLIQNEKEEARI